jgi:5-hydroxyisourate hydrolase
LVVGDYRLEFGLAPIDPVDGAQPAADVERFFRRVAIDIHVGDPARTYHVPLLLAPFSLTTYRGS